jgi:hypothetical protein
MAYTAAFKWTFGPDFNVTSATPRDAPAFVNDGSFSLLVWPTTSSTMAAGAAQDEGPLTFLTGAAVDTTNMQFSIASSPALLPLGGGLFIVFWADPLTQELLTCTCGVSVDAAGTFSAVWTPATPLYDVAFPPAADAPAVCIDGTTAYLAWRGNANSMWFATAILPESEPTTTSVTLSWTDPIPLGSLFNGPSRPALAVFSDTVLMAFCGFASGPNNVSIVYTSTTSTTNPAFTTSNPAFTTTATLFDGNGTMMTSFNAPVLTATPTGFLAVLRAGLGGEEMIPMESPDGSTWNAYQDTGYLSAFACGAANAGQAGQLAFWSTGNSGFQTAQATLASDPVSPTVSVNPATWMTNLAAAPGGFSSLPLNQICMLGSHDAGMFTFFSLALLSPLVAPIVYGMCVAQSLTIQDQLNSGSRYFDLRPTQNLVGQYATYHGAFQFAVGPTIYAGYGAVIQAILNQVVSFIQSTPGAAEIIILKFSHPSGLSADDLTALSQMVSNTLQGHLYTTPLPPNTRLADLTYATLVGQSGVPATVVIPVFDLDTAAATAFPGLYKYADYDNKQAATADLTVFDQYSNTISITAMVPDQTAKLRSWTRLCADGVTPCDLFLLSWTLTPQSVGEFVSACADVANSAFSSQYPPLLNNTAPNRPNILYFDFVQDANAIAACVSTTLST